MTIRDQVSLADFSTMRLGGAADHLVAVHDKQELSEAIAWAEARSLPMVMIGSGSNIVWRDDGYRGLVIVNQISGLTQSDVGDSVYVTCGAGENWDAVVAKTVELGLSGIEGLSLVPGSCGATPVQNVGAYGQEIAQTLITLEAYDRTAQQFVTLRASDCHFGYRTSCFKTTDKNRYFIISITLALHKTNPLPPYYPALQQYFAEHQLNVITPAVMRQAVIAIRQAKLPDPAIVANNGSFFANPVVSQAAFDAMQQQSDGLVPHWSATEGMVKLSAAWLMDQVGFSDFHDPETGMATWPTQTLVLVNEAAKTTADLLSFKQKIIAAVAAKFKVTLVQEPELLPS